MWYDVWVRITKRRLELLGELSSGMRTVRYGIMDEFFHQTVAEHTARMLELADEFGPDLGLNMNRVRAVIMAHDLPEMEMDCDITSWELAQDPSLQAVKEGIERGVVAKLAARYGDWIAELFYEYEGQATDVARFVRWLDKYESNLYIMEKFAQRECPFEWIAHNTQRVVDATVKFPVMRDVALRRMDEVRPMFERYGRLDEWGRMRLILVQG